MRRSCRPCSRHYSLKDAQKAAKRVSLPAGATVLHLLEGMNVEREHGDVTCCDPVLTARIAAAHLRERLDYYVLLKRYVER